MIRELNTIQNPQTKIEKNVYVLPKSKFYVTVLDKSINIGDNYLYFGKEIVLDDLMTIDNYLMLAKASVVNSINDILNIKNYD